LKKPETVQLQVSRQLFNLVILLFCGFSFGQNDSLMVEFVAYWDLGDSFDYRITKTRKNFDSEVLTASDSTTYFGTFTVIDSTANEYLINWKYKANFTDLPLEYSELLNNNSIVLDFKYKTTELGEFLGLENWEEVAETLRSNLKSGKAADLNNTGIGSDLFLQSIYKDFLTKEAVEELILAELQLFHFPFGSALDPNEDLVYENEFTNFFGDDPLKGTTEIKFADVDYENLFCVFTTKSSINEDDAKQMLTEFLLKTYPKNGLVDMSKEKIEEILNEFKYDVTDDNVFSYFYYPGVPFVIESNRIVEISSPEIQRKSIETKRIELIFDED